VGAGYERLFRYSGGCIYVKEEIETKREMKQDKGVKAGDEGNLIQQATDTWQKYIPVSDVPAARE
jgi:hypothetical protein